MRHLKRLHWFPFCPADWTSKIISRGLSIPAEGCLIALCCIQWQEGSIPADREALVRCLRGYDGPGLEEALTLFCHCIDDNRRLYYPLLKAVREEAITASKSLSKAGKKGAIRKAAKRMSKIDPVFTDSRN